MGTSRKTGVTLRQHHSASNRGQCHIFSLQGGFSRCSIVAVTAGVVFLLNLVLVPGTVLAQQPVALDTTASPIDASSTARTRKATKAAATTITTSTTTHAIVGNDCSYSIVHDTGEALVGAPLAWAVDGVWRPLACRVVTTHPNAPGKTQHEDNHNNHNIKDGYSSRNAWSDGPYEHWTMHAWVAAEDDHAEDVRRAATPLLQFDVRNYQRQRPRRPTTHNSNHNDNNDNDGNDDDIDVESWVTFSYTVLDQPIVPGLNPNQDASSSLVTGNFPAFLPSSTTTTPTNTTTTNRYDGRLSWHGSFVQASVGTRCRTGLQGGPCVLYETGQTTPPYDQSNNNTATHQHQTKNTNALIVSALDPVLGTSRDTRLHDGSPAAWVGGWSSTVTVLPAGFQHTFVVTGSVHGVTDVVHQWGMLVREYAAAASAATTTKSTVSMKNPNTQITTTTRPTMVPDVTVEKLGYQTDNGAQYCFGCGDNCTAVLLDAITQLRDIHQVPIAYLSYQNAWWKRTARSAPWCVSEWTGAPSIDVADFQRRLGLPLQLYAPYLCTDTPYQHPAAVVSSIHSPRSAEEARKLRQHHGQKRSTTKESTPWHPHPNVTFLRSNPHLPNCAHFEFLTAKPSDSYEFYTWFFGLGASYGMTSYEWDFVNQNLNCVEEFLSNPTAASTLVDGMLRAARDWNLSIQWCYASPNAMLYAATVVDGDASDHESSSDRTPPLNTIITNARASFDFYYGNSWNIGSSSLLLSALGIAPSTDTFWTSNNGDMAMTLGGCDPKQTACPPDHSDDGALLHTMLAILSTGPVGISDAIGHTDAVRIRATCRTDGILLKPNKPVTTIDGTLEHKDEDPYILQTYSGPSDGSTIWAYYILGHHLNQTKTNAISIRDQLWPRPSQTFWPGGSSLPDMLLMWYNDRAACERPGGPLDACATLLSTDHGQAEPKVQIPSTRSIFRPELATLVPVCPNGWAVLGQVQKYVALSPQRILSVECVEGSSLSSLSPGSPFRNVDSGVMVQVWGGPGESGQISFAAPDNTIRIMDFSIPTEVESSSVELFITHRQPGSETNDGDPI